MGILNIHYGRDCAPSPEDLEGALNTVFPESDTCTFGVHVNDDRGELDGKPLPNFGRVEVTIQDMTVSEWHLLQLITKHPVLKNIVGAAASDDE